MKLTELSHTVQLNFIVYVNCVYRVNYTVRFTQLTEAAMHKYYFYNAILVITCV